MYAVVEHVKPLAYNYFPAHFLALEKSGGGGGGGGTGYSDAVSVQ